MRSRRLSAGLVSALLGVLCLAPAARADTTFGANPAEGINTTLSCSTGAPYIAFETLFPPPASVGAQSCMWTWNNPSVGTDIVPFPVTGGSGTITSVTVPAMPNPGPMAVVILTAALNATTNPSTPNSICCQVKQVGPTFTVPANRVTTVAQSLHVSATEEANLNEPGDTSFADLVGLAVLSPSASLPIRYTGNVGNVSITNFDGAYAYYPAPGGPNGEYAEPYDPAGFRLLARFTLAPEGGAKGLRLIRRPLRVGGDGRTLALGRAANPPTARTVQTLTAPAAGRAAASANKKKRKVVYGRGKTTIAAGKTAKLKLKLTSRARKQLKKRHRLKLTLTVLAFNAAGEKQKVTRRVTVKPAKRK